MARMLPDPKVTALAERIARIEAASRKRPLTDDEQVELVALLKVRGLRKSRIPSRITACERKIRRLRAEMALLT